MSRLDCDVPLPRVLIAAGPTMEDIDAVRYLTNRSSGTMGLEIARAVLDRGGTPLLVLGPVHLEPPKGAVAIMVRSARQMRDAVLNNLSWCDGLVMAAAVADYEPADPVSRKLKKGSGELLLRLKRTPDILLEVSRHPGRAGKFVIGFSLDIGLDLEEGRRKMAEKCLDMIVVNTTASFASTTAEAHLLWRDGAEESLGVVSKAFLAARIASCLGTS